MNEAHPARAAGHKVFVRTSFEVVASRCTGGPVPAASVHEVLRAHLGEGYLRCAAYERVADMVVSGEEIHRPAVEAACSQIVAALRLRSEAPT
jgi:hypothetical protein